MAPARPRLLRYPWRIIAFLSLVVASCGTAARAEPFPSPPGEGNLRPVIGILFPGGNQGIDPSDIYTEEGAILWNLAKQANDRGDYYPIWGTCLGSRSWPCWRRATAM